MNEVKKKSSSSSSTSSNTPLNVPPTLHEETSSTNDKKQKITWSKQTEELIASWGDIASCYKWMHDEGYRKYDTISYRMMIPIAVLSTVTGSLNMSMSSLVPEDYVATGNKILGGVSIFTGILTSLQSYFRFAQKSEGHSNAAVGWGKLERNIRIELRIDKAARKDADSFMKVCRAEYDRLLEQSPVIPKDVIKKFKNKFNHISNLVKPDVCDNLEHTNIIVDTEVESKKINLNIQPFFNDPSINDNLSDDKTDILKEIKDMLSESRLVSVGYKDDDIPTPPPQNQNRWRSASNIQHSYNSNESFKGFDMMHIKPRKSFMSHKYPPKIEIDNSNINVKDIIRKFSAKSPFEDKNQSSVHDTVIDISHINIPKNDEKNDVKNDATQEDMVIQASETKTELNTNMINDNKDSDNVHSVAINIIDEISLETNEKRTQEKIPTIDMNDII